MQNGETLRRHNKSPTKCYLSFASLLCIAMSLHLPPTRTMQVTEDLDFLILNASFHGSRESLFCLFSFLVNGEGYIYSPILSCYLQVTYNLSEEGNQTDGECNLHLRIHITSRLDARSYCSASGTLGSLGSSDLLRNEKVR